MAGRISVGRRGRRVAPQGCDAQRQDSAKGIRSYPRRDHRGNRGWSAPISRELDPWEPLVTTPAPRGRGSNEHHVQRPPAQTEAGEGGVVPRQEGVEAATGSARGAGGGTSRAPRRG